MSNQISIILKSEENYGRRVPLAPFGGFLESLAPVVRGSVQMAFQRRSISRGRRPNWLARAADVRFVGYDTSNGDTVLQFEAPTLGEAAGELYSQGELWPERPDADDTALDLVGDVVTAIGSGDSDSRWLDTPMLRNVGRFRRSLEGEFTAAYIHSPRYESEPAKLDNFVIEAARSMRASAPAPQQTRIVGSLDMVRLSTQNFGLKLADGSSIDGILLTGDINAIKSLMSNQVLVRGKIVYRPSGRPLRIDAESIETAVNETSLWSSLPSPPAERLRSVFRAPQSSTTGVGAIIGKWPGDETDEQIAEALEKIS